MARQRCPEVFSDQISTYVYDMVNLCFDCRIVTSCLEANAVNFQIAYEGDFRSLCAVTF